MTFLGAVERLFTIVVQISLAVIVVQSFIRKQKRWLWLAIGYHALIDAVAVYATSKLNPYWVEGIVGLFALISLGIIFILRSPEPAETVTPVLTHHRLRFQWWNQLQNNLIIQSTHRQMK